MPKNKTSKCYNLQPSEFWHPDFLNIASIGFSKVRLQTLREVHQRKKLDEVLGSRIKINPEDGKRNLYVNFYINPLVDLHSILKAIVKVSRATAIEFVDTPYIFNPTKVSIENIMNTNDFSRYMYKVTTPVFEPFYISVSPGEEKAFTKVCIKAHPVPMSVAFSLIHYLGGFMEVPITSSNVRYYSALNGFKRLKLSKQGRWKENFTINSKYHIFEEAKDKFFEKMEPYCIESMLNWFNPNNDVVFTQEEKAQIEELLEQEQSSSNEQHQVVNG